jgi:hypothetical protein
MKKTTDRESEIKKWLKRKKVFIAQRARVRMTKLAIERRLAPSRTGTLISISKDGKFVYVLRDKRKTIQRYSIDFWEIED